MSGSIVGSAVVVVVGTVMALAMLIAKLSSPRPLAGYRRRGAAKWSAWAEEQRLARKAREEAEQSQPRGNRFSGLDL